MEKIIDKILNEYSQLNIIAILKTGSQLFRTNPSDIDIEVVIDGYDQKYSRKIYDIDGVKYDVILKDEKFLVDSINNPDLPNASNHGKLPLFNYLYNLSETIYGNKTYMWDMFANEKKYMGVIKEIYINGPGKTVNRSFMTKFWVHYYIIAKIYTNLSYTLTNEMLNDIDILYNKPTQAEAIIEWIESVIL